MYFNSEGSYGSGNLFDAANFIDSIPVEQFNIEYFWLKDGMAFDDDRNTSYEVAKHSVGCAIGHMVNAGFGGLKKELLDCDRDVVYMTVANLFGIPVSLAKFIFSKYSYMSKATKEMVSARVRFIANEQQSICVKK